MDTNLKETNMRKFLKFAGILIAFLVALILLAIILLITFVSPNRLKPVLTEQVMKYTGRQLLIDGDMSWTFFPYLGVKVGHSSLSNPADFNQKISVSNIPSGNYILNITGDKGFRSVQKITVAH